MPRFKFQLCHLRPVRLQERYLITRTRLSSSVNWRKVTPTHGVVYVCSKASVVSDSLQPHGPQPVGLLCPWDFPGKNTTVGCHALLQGSSPLRDQIRVS